MCGIICDNISRTEQYTEKSVGKSMALALAPYKIFGLFPAAWNTWRENTGPF
jgi:hypothetical protein